MIDFLPRKAASVRLIARVGPPASLVALASILMAPMLRTGYLSDDTVSSTTPGMLVVTGWTLWTRIFDTIQYSMREGRFYPLHWVAFSGVFAVIQDVFSYKLYLLSLVVLDVLLFYVLARRLFADAGLGLLAACVALMLMQFRAYHDPILSFFGLMQIVAALTFLALLMLLRWLDGGGRGWLFGAAALYLASMLLYETTYPFVLLFMAVIGLRLRGWKARLGAAAPFLLAVGFCAGASVLLRWSSRGAAETPHHYAMNLAPVAVLSAVLRQTSGELPLSYFLADPAGLFGRLKGLAAAPQMIARPGAFAVLALSAILGFIGLARGTKSGKGAVGLRGNARSPWVVGISLTILPAIMISLSSRYQGEIALGKSYIPVFVQYFGVAILLTALARTLARGFPTRGAALWLRLALAAFLGCATAVTYRSNVAFVESLLAPPGSPDFNVEAYYMGAWHQDRLNLEAAMHAGLLDPVPPHARLLPDHGLGMPFDGVFFYAMHTGKVLEPIAPERVAISPPAPTSAPVFRVREVALSESAGYAILFRDDGGPEARVFLRMPGLIANGLPARLPRLGPRHGYDGRLVLSQAPPQPAHPPFRTGLGDLFARRRTRPRPAGFPGIGHQDLGRVPTRRRLPRPHRTLAFRPGFAPQALVNSHPGHRASLRQDRRPARQSIAEENRAFSETRRPGNRSSEVSSSPSSKTSICFGERWRTTSRVSGHTIQT